MTYNVVIATYLEPEQVERIAHCGEDVIVQYRPDLLPPPRYACDHTGPARDLSPAQIAEWRAIVANADVMWDFDWHEPETMVERCPTLQWVQGTSAGIGGFVQRTGIDQGNFILTTAGGIHAVPLAEFAVMGALHFIKGVPQLNSWKQQHHWQRYTTRQLKGCRALVVGLGGMGREIVRQFAVLGVEVIGLGRPGRHYETPGLIETIDRADLINVLPSMDILVLASPLTRETEGLISAQLLSVLKSDAIIVNVSRGQLIDQSALIEALANNRIAGACLDVFEQEPLPKDSPLWDLQNVIISPHSASTVVTENRDIVTLFIENLGRLRRGEPLRNVYDRVAGY